LHHILMTAVQNRHLEVIARCRGDIGLGVERQQSLCLRTDRDNAAGERQAGRGIVDGDGLAGGIENS